MTQNKLDEEVNREVERMWLKGGNLVHTQNHSEAKELMEKAWEILPTPKENHSPSYHITKNLVGALIGLEQHEEAKKWFEIHQKTGLNRIDGGEKDFLEGELYYATGDLETAKACFTIANKKSGGRLFHRREQVHFKELLSKENIRPTSLTELLKTAKQEIRNKSYSYALDLLYDALNLNQMKPEVHFNKGLCHFELNELNHATESFTHAYMLAGDTIFKKHDAKYFEFLKTRIEIVK